MVDTPIILTGEVRALKTLAKQLRICSENKAIHIDCVLYINDVEENCDEKISALLDACFKQVDGPSPQLASYLTELVVSCESAIENCLNNDEHLADLLKWTTVLKALNDSVRLNSTMWVASKSPMDLRKKLVEEIKKRNEQDLVRKFLFDSPELGNFLKEKSKEEKFSDSIDEVIANFRYSSTAKKDVQELIDTIPTDFKFIEGVFDKLFELEYALLNSKMESELIRQFYKFLFFAYDNAAEYKEICQKYASLNRYSEEFSEKREIFSSKVYNGFCSKLIGALLKNKTGELDRIFRWMFVIRPDCSVALEHGDAFANPPLPIIPPKQEPYKEVDAKGDAPIEYAERAEKRDVPIASEQEQRSVKDDVPLHSSSDQGSASEFAVKSETPKLLYSRKTSKGLRGFGNVYHSYKTKLDQLEDQS